MKPLNLLTLLFLATSKLIFSQTCLTCPNQTDYGNGSWIGYVYDHNGAGNPVTNPFATYKGCVTETANFNRNWGTGSPSCAAGGNNFGVRYRMRMNFAPGTYSFTIGGDDGVRLSFDGGATWEITDWVDHSYRTTTATKCLSGTIDLVLEYYEKGGDARVSFSFTQTSTDFIMPQLTSRVNTCGGMFYDSGGSGGNYTDSEDRTITFFPTNSCDKVRLTFSAFSTENNFDGMQLFNGNSIAAPLISSGLGAGSNATTCPAGSWRGTGSPGTVTSTAADGSLTIRFRSDASVVSSGWAAAISCVAAPNGTYPNIFGNNVWIAYGFNGTNAVHASNMYRGRYTQPALGGGNEGISTTTYWGNTNSPSFAGTTVNSGNLWTGCPVDSDNHTVIFKRRGFNCGLYNFNMIDWDDPAEVIINGTTIWSCASWSGSGACTPGSIGNYSLDANSEVEVRFIEFGGNSNLNLTITQIQPTLLGINGSTRTCPVNGGSNFINFVDNNGRLIAAVNPQGNNLGNVTMTSYVQTAPFQIDACLDPQPQFNTATLGRRWVITPTTQPVSPVTVRLYYHANEYNALEPIANSNANVNDNTVGYYDLHLSKYHNSTNPALVNSSATDNCPSGVTTIHGPGASGTAASVITGFDANGLYNEYTISSFSEFWLHGSNNMSPLPVTLTAFNASCEDNGVRINWSTASEQNASHFDVERSRDGLDWETIGTLSAAGTTNTPQNYEVTDASFAGGTIYYRLRQVDQDGTTELYGPISATCEAAGYSLSVFPNPATNSFTVQVYAESTVSGGQLGVYDFTGKAIIQQAVELQNGVHTFHFNDAGLARGTYLIRLTDSEGRFTPVRLVIQ